MDNNGRKSPIQEAFPINTDLLHVKKGKRSVARFTGQTKGLTEGGDIRSRAERIEK